MTARRQKNRITAPLLGLTLALLLLSGCAKPAGENTVTPSTSGASGGSSQDSDVSRGTESATAPLPAGFSYVTDVVPGIQVQARYATSDNFTGEIVDGYSDDSVVILRTEAAEALTGVQEDLEEQELGLLAWDGYRPTRAVDNFVAWSESPDESTKADYYPDHDKPALFELGYIAKESRHSLGGTIDLTIVDAQGEQLDMGGAFDFFGDLSHYGAAGLTPAQEANRELLHTTMEAHGFEHYPQEWWHFTFPLPEGTAPQNFPVQ